MCIFPPKKVPNNSGVSNYPQIYQSSAPLRIGYLENDGFSSPSPSVTRAMREVRALLEQAGHTVRTHRSPVTHHHHLTCVSYELKARLFVYSLQLVSFTPLNVPQTATQLLVKGILADGAASLLQKL